MRVLLHAENRGCLADSPFNRESLSRSFSLWKLWLCINCALFIVFSLIVQGLSLVFAGREVYFDRLFARLAWIWFVFCLIVFK